MANSFGKGEFGGKRNGNKKEKLEQIINQSANPSRLEPEQIPELELYIDQILMLFEDKLGENRRRENDKILTKSMVNNYSKEKMIRPMRGKNTAANRFCRF